MMIYFKDAPISPSNIDPESIAKIRSFQESLGEEGVLYWKFEETENFEQLVRIHLARQIQAWKDGIRPETDSGQKFVEILEKPEDKDIEFDDDGIFELLDLFDEKISNLTEITDRITDATNELTERINEATDEINKLPRDTEGNASRNDARRIIRRVSSHLESFTTRIEAERPLFGDAMNSGVNSLIKAITLSSDLNYDNEEDSQQKEEALGAVVELRSAISASRASMHNLRESISETPRITKDLNRAKRGATYALDKLLIEFTNGETMLLESEKAMREFIHYKY